MAYILWESASWSTSSADALCEDGNLVALEVVSAAVPNLLNPPHLLHSLVEVVEVDSEAALTVAVADSAEVVAAGLVEDVEEDSETAVALAIAVEVVLEAVAVASEVTGTTLDPREVEGATEVGVAVWDTKVEDSTKVRLRAGMEVPLDQAVVVGLVDQVGTVLLVGVQVTAPLEEVVLVVLAATETEDISSERAQEGLTTETLSGRDSRCFAIAPHQVLL